LKKRQRGDVESLPLFTTMTRSHLRGQVFRRILQREAGAARDAPAIAAATRRLCERFAHQLTPLLGDAGVAAICTRTLHLAQRQVPGLASAQVSPQDDGPFTRVQHLLENQEPTLAAEAGVAVLTTFGQLLGSFIGESLTTRLLLKAWPDDFAGDTTEETTT
jgi:hypothetical protein